jgi:hypothetical protein
MIRSTILPAASVLMSAFIPSEEAVIERMRSLDWRALSMSGQRVEMAFSLPNEASRQRAEQLARDGAGMAMDLPGAILADLMISIRNERLIVEAVLVNEDP